MGKYDDAAQQAAQETDQELEKDIKDLLSLNPALFPVEADKEAISELISKVNKSTSRNEMVTAVQACALKLTVDGVKMLKEGFDVAKKVLV